MSVCYDNTTSGQCNYVCEEFDSGSCLYGDDAVDNFHAWLLTNAELENELLKFYNPVELWMLRNKHSDYDLLEAAIKDEYIE